MPRDAAYDMEHAVDGPVTAGRYNGVRYRRGHDGFRYAIDDVTGIVFGDDVESSRRATADIELTMVDDGVGYVSSHGLATIVDTAIGLDFRAPRNVWVQGWFDDLYEHVELGESSRRFSPEMFDAIASVLEMDDIDLYEATDGEIAGSLRKLGRRAIDAGSLRRQVRRALEPMSRALQNLEDAVTYADGLRTGVSLASPDGACVGSLVNLFIDLRGAEDELERVNSQLEDIANGGDDD